MTFVAALLFMCALALALVAVPLWRHGRKGEALFGGVFVAGVALGVYLLLGRPDLGLEPPVAAQAQPPDIETPDIETLVAQLAQRLETAPDDVQGWIMLGRTYMLMGRYAEAANAFAAARTRASDDSVDLLASFAEARALQDTATLAGETGALFERVLELDPENPRGLWYGGLAAQARGDTATALARWQTLLARGLPANFRQVVENRIAAVDPAAIDALLRVSVAVAPELADAMPPNATLFVFLRSNRQAGENAAPPLAARKVEYFALPVTLPLTQRDLLLIDALPPEEEFIVMARLSVDGDPAPGAGDLEGSARWISGQPEVVEIALDSRRAE